MSYSAFGGFMRLPLWLLYRDLDYFQQRLWIFAGRAAGFVVTIGLALAGAGIWSLVIGGIASLVVTGVPAWLRCRFRPRWRFDLAEFRSLAGFSSPIWFSKLAYVMVQQGCILVLSLCLPARDVGQYKSAEQLAAIVFYLEVVIGQTIFPVLCRLKDDPARLVAIFEIANRVTVAWVAAFSVGLCLFAGDIVRFLLTSKWAGAEMFLRAQGAAVVFGAIFFSWDTIFKARNLTRPIFYLSVGFTAIFLVVFVPLTLFGGKTGAAIGLVAVNFLMLVGRCYFLWRLNLGISVISIIKWPLAASAIAAAAEQAVARSSLGLGPFALFLIYGIVYSAVLLWLERSLLRQVMNLLSGDRQVAIEPAGAGSAQV
jgi:lipopolysaccharide exporter